MEIVTKKDIIEKKISEKNEYMFVGCYVVNSIFRYLEAHVFLVPIKMFKKEQLLSQWISDNGYYTQSNKISLPKALLTYNDNYIILQEEYPMELKEGPSNNDKIGEWCFCLNNYPIGYITLENLEKNKYNFYDFYGEKTFNLYKRLYNKMINYPKEIKDYYGIERLELGKENNNISMKFDNSIV